MRARMVHLPTLNFCTLEHMPSMKEKLSYLQECLNKNKKKKETAHDIVAPSLLYSLYINIVLLHIVFLCV